MTRLAQRLAFDAQRGEIRDQARRYLLLRPDVLMGMLLRLDPPARQAALGAFAASVAQHGRDSVLAYLDRLGGDRGRLLDDTESLERAHGLERAREVLAFAPQNTILVPAWR